MGAAEARLFAREGAQIVVGDVLEAEGRGVEAEINAKGGKAVFVHLDVTSEADWQKAVGAAQSHFGRLNVLVNNAGIGGGGRIEDTTVEDWDRMMAINSKGVFLGTKTAIPAMRRAGGGSIINISSAAGLVGTPAFPAYSASKGAVRLLSKSVALYCAEKKYGIRCNSVHPGGVDTPIFNPLWQAMGHEQGKALIGSHHPIGRMAEPNDLGELILWLASDRSAFVTGAEFVADGAYTTGLRRRTGFGPS